jgi:hypothetical protein
MCFYHEAQTSGEIIIFFCKAPFSEKYSLVPLLLVQQKSEGRK